VLFNEDKCKVMHIACNNRIVKYEMEKKNLEAVAEERDMGVTVQGDLKWN
jgi:hypothetical protein